MRQAPAADGAAPIDVVDILRSFDAEIIKNVPPLISRFAVQRASGAGLPLRFYKLVIIDGPMPDGRRNRVEIAVASIPALLAMKGFAIRSRYKQKDAYDICYCVRNCRGGIALAEDCRPLLDHAEGQEGYPCIAKTFDAVAGFGPTCVQRFVQDTQILGERTPEEWQMDAFGRWMRGCWRWA